MGATILVGMKAAALRRANGQVVYFLFEHTYEKNLHPHDPHWSCVAIGPYDQVLARIFQGAAACEGGSLQGRGRDLLPENCIRRWQRALRAPLTMPDVRIRVAPTLPYARDDEIQPYREKVAVVLAQHGHPDLAETFRVGQDFTLELVADLDLVLALHGAGGPVSPWRAVRVDQTEAAPVPELAPPRVAEPVVSPDYAVWALDADVRVGKVGNQPLAVLGWEYRAVGDFLCKHVYPLELRRTGVSTDLIRRFRRACRSAPMLPDTVRVGIRLGETLGAHPWQLECAARIVAALGVVHGPAVSTTLGDLRRVGALRDLSSLNAAQLHWDETSVADGATASGVFASAA
ncbi:hypothetical protein ACQVRY_13825 [Ralstonia pseudosolanacearum]|nr:hypothetical protein [Ralstonia solanacearum]